jgi:hypothetical protein
MRADGVMFWKVNGRFTSIKHARKCMERRGEEKREQKEGRRKLLGFNIRFRW